MTSIPSLRSFILLKQFSKIRFKIHCKTHFPAIAILLFINVRDTGTITTVLSNRFGCDSIVIRKTQLVASGILLQLSIEKQLTCFGDSTAEVLLKTPVGGKLPYQIRWNNGDTTGRIRGLIAGKHTISVTDARGCTIQDSIFVASPTPLSISTDITPPRCFGESTGSITVTAIRGSDAPYRLKFAGKNNLVNFPYIIPNLKAQDYSFTVTDNKGCQITESVNLPQPPPLTAIFNDKLMTLKLGDSIQLTPLLNFAPRSLKWTPSQFLDCDTCLTPMALPKASINYKLEAFDEKRCSVFQQINIKLSPERNIFAPTIFSPNGDAQNDFFTVFSDGTVERIKILEIYDRWGEKVFMNHNFLPNIENEGWDGIFKGKDAEAGVYIYYFTVIFKDGKEATIQGELSLAR